MPELATTLAAGQSLALSARGDTVRVSREGGSAGVHDVRVGGVVCPLAAGGRGVRVEVGGLPVMLYAAPGWKAGAVLRLRVDAPREVVISRETRRAG